MPGSAEPAGHGTMPEPQSPETPPPSAVSAPVHDGGLRGVRLVGVLTLVSRILGMIRDVAMAAAFGAGPVMDTFSVAFRIPNLARRLFGEGAQTSAFLPVFVRTQEQAGQEAARELARGMFVTLGLLLVGLVGLAEAGLIWLWLYGALSPNAALLVELLIWLLPYVVGICLAAQQTAVMHGLKQFGWPAALPCILNLIWLAVIPIAFLASPDPVERIRWLCGAILLGGAAQMLIPMVLLHRQGYSVFGPWRAARQRVREVFLAMAPVLIGVTITQINTVFDSLLAWGLSIPESESASRQWLTWLPALPIGTASALYFGQRMYQFPLGLIGVGMGTVLFPQFARHAERGDYQELNRRLTEGLKLTIAVGLPAGVGLMLLARPITSLLFEHGEFTAESGTLTSGMMFAYGPAVPAFIGLLLIQRAYYALGDRMTPLWHGFVAMGVNLILDFALLIPLGAYGLACATSLAACTQAALGGWMLQRQIGTLPWRDLCRVGLRCVVACGAMSAACIATSPEVGESLIQRAFAVLLPLAAGVAAFLGTAWLVGLREPLDLLWHGDVQR